MSDTQKSTPGPVQRILEWLRAGYPSGIPKEDYFAVLGVLKRTLPEHEVEDVVATLTAQAQAPITEADVRSELAGRDVQSPTSEDVARVAGRLAEAGWPLADPADVYPPSAVVAAAAAAAAVAITGAPPANGSSPTDGPEPASGAEPAGGEGGRLPRIVSWVREGYPSGVPATDFVPLLALLRRRLTDDEVKGVSRSLRSAGVAPVDVIDIGQEIAKVTNELPSVEDIRRVHDHLARKGWPVEFPDPG